MNPLSTQLQERIAEIAKQTSRRAIFISPHEIRKVVSDWLTDFATDPLLREELEQPLRDKISMMSDTEASAHAIEELEKESDTLRERIAELEGYLAGKDSELSEANRAIESFVTLIQERHAELLALQAQVAKIRQAEASDDTPCAQLSQEGETRP